MKSLQNSLSSLEKGEVAKKSGKDKLVFKIRDSLVDALSSDEKTDSTEDISSIPYSIPRGKIDLTNVDLSGLGKLEPIPDKLDLRSLSPESLETLDQISIELKYRERAHKAFLEGGKVDLTNVDLSGLRNLEEGKLDFTNLSFESSEKLAQTAREIKIYENIMKKEEINVINLTPEMLFTFLRIALHAGEWERFRENLKMYLKDPDISEEIAEVIIFIIEGKIDLKGTSVQNLESVKEGKIDLKGTSV